MSKTAQAFVKLVRIILLGALVFSIGAIARAQIGSENQLLFGNLGQLNAGVTYINPNYGTVANPSVAVGPNACVPTSVVNGLVYLNNIWGGNLFNNYNPNSYAAVNDMAKGMGTFNLQNGAGGTYYGYANTVQANINEISGLANYITGGGANPAPKVSVVGGQYTSGIVGNGTGIPAALSPLFSAVIPTAQVLADWLNARDAVTFWIQWGTYNAGLDTFTVSGGMHSVTLTSILDDNGSGDMTFWDPWGDGGTSATFTTANIATSVGGYLYLTDFTGTDPEGGDGGILGDGGSGAGQALTGRIVADFAQTAVPEPSTYFAGALVLLPFCLAALRKYRKIRAVP